MPDSKAIACVSYDPETDLVGPEPRVPAEMLAVAADAADRYAALAAGMAEGAAEWLHVAFDPGIAVGDGRGPRHVRIAATAPGLSAEVERATGRTVGGLDALVTLGPGFVAWDGDDERLREVVASDVGRVACLLYPARAEGPLAVLMPWLLQVAAETVAHGTTEPALARERAERSAARAFTGAAQQNYDSWNAHGQMLTDHPAWTALVEATMDEAVAAASSVRVPASLEALAVAAHGALAAALSGLGVRVVPGTGSQA